MRGIGGRRNTNGGLERPPDGQNHRQPLEAELRPKADSQIVVRAIQKVNVVADFGSNSDRSGERLETSAGIHRKTRGAAAEPG